MILLSDLPTQNVRASFRAFDLKPLSPTAVPRALKKAQQYRLLNEPGAAESICLDILAIDPNNQGALITIVLAMSDRFGKDYAVGDSLIYSFITRIEDEYARAYYTGTIYERRAKTALRSDGLNAMNSFGRQWIGLKRPRNSAAPATTIRSSAGMNARGSSSQTSFSPGYRAMIIWNKFRFWILDFGFWILDFVCERVDCHSQFPIMLSVVGYRYRLWRVNVIYAILCALNPTF